MKLVENWRAMWKSWTLWLAGLGIFLPDVLQVIADNSELLPWLDVGYKSLIRMACLILIIPARLIKQPALSQPPTESPK